MPLIGFPGGEWWKVIMQGKFIGALYQHFINHFFIHLVPQGNRGQRLGFPPGEDGGSVRSRQVIYLTPYRTDLIGLPAIHPQPLARQPI